MDAVQVGEFAQAIPQWRVNEAATMISRKLNAGNFSRAIRWINEIGEIAEQQQHHPDLHLTGYRHLQVDLTTHAIGGLSENDFIVAAQIDRLIDSNSSDSA
ncbi:pterin-4-alpha-carbinolamine dehydratase [Roseiconus nitratireducens]|uniref:4a-hydroxytetrahydrobiopterin dehydratase n=2 Tax=Roseiconus nitratireducens TaxID=2605748 RepID=A0A5M6D976_9BACT|nr:pterin-4-alpha-carbinolamine dehydratase [Roseiconus nitratireducens]